MNKADGEQLVNALEISLAVMEELGRITELDEKLPMEDNFDLIREWKRKARLYDELKPDEQLID